MKLLLVEDNPTMQATLQRSLSRRGMEVAVCGDGGRRWTAGPRFNPTWSCST
jgi:two-component system response regulator TctD